MAPRIGLIITMIVLGVGGSAAVLALEGPQLAKSLQSSNQPAAQQRPSRHRASTKKSERRTRVPGTPATPGKPSAPAAKPGSQRGMALHWKIVAGFWIGSAIFGPLLFIAVVGRCIRNRRRNRRTRQYGLYEIHLSMHDEAKPQDLEDMVEALANLVREFPEQRAAQGQPFLAVELHYGPTDEGMEWTLCLRCEKDLARSVDGIVAAAYTDVRVGQVYGEEPREIGGALPEPGYVMRFRKDRAFVYALNAEDDKAASPPIEAIAQAQVALGRPSTVRLLLTPAPLAIENFARRRYHRHENKLVRQETWGLREAGLKGSLNRQEMADAKRTQNKSMFWLEVQVAAETREDCNRVAAAVQARRGDNRLTRRWWLLPYRHDLYRRRFTTSEPPLWPTPSLRTLVSSAEMAMFLTLPSSRMKGVPVRRLTTPRLPAPPEITRTDDLPPAAPLPISDRGEMPAMPPPATAV